MADTAAIAKIRNIKVHETAKHMDRAMEDCRVLGSLSARIDASLSALGAIERRLEDSLGKCESYERSYMQQLLDAVHGESEHLRALRRVSADLQYIAIKAERDLEEQYRRVDRARNPRFLGVFHLRPNRPSVVRSIRTFKGMVESFRKQAQAMLQGADSFGRQLDLDSLMRVHRTVDLMHQPLLFRTIHLLAKAKHASEQAQHLDAGSDEGLIEREIIRRRTETIERIAQVEQEFTDLLQQRDQFAVEEVQQALNDIAASAWEVSKQLEGLQNAQGSLDATQLDAAHVAAEEATAALPDDNPLRDELARLEATIEAWIDHPAAHPRIVVRQYAEQLHAITSAAQEAA